MALLMNEMLLYWSHQLRERDVMLYTKLVEIRRLATLLADDYEDIRHKVAILLMSIDYEEQADLAISELEALVG